ncbi:hypothetical protein Desaci_4395 [Desulfosporosinus acidiphilus SJ4]|uniref:Uncharacterized protein n=1 Tax=Desulfosporosinus acidiphilus (strain DSM 22704 / JCM 16185 / SJ4) TaxID=646529 RepID=I4DBR5_DESAJ|nr:hypothetical protein [Desulfosporosinus acidiphilus]AFM43239.1 hypothetical protein Desaci_4395 [Desulfosporosinus acidiphilus SJ4]
MRALIKNLFSSYSSEDEPPLNEAEQLLGEIEESREKIEYAWNHFYYADPEYVEIAVLELLLAETQYCILNKRYRLMLGIQEKSLYWEDYEEAFPSFSLESMLQHHAYYGTFFTGQNKPVPVVSQLLTQNPS